jgi:hypothetical protein
VGILRPVVEALMLPMLDARHDLMLARGVAAQSPELCLHHTNQRTGVGARPRS